MIRRHAASAIFNFFKKALNFRLWVDFDRIKAFGFYLWNGAKVILVPQEAKKKTSFHAVVKSMHLTEEDLLLKQQALLRLSRIMVCMSGLVFLYALYLLFQAYFHTALLSFVVSLLALVFSFRYHFWYFQIKTRQLGCTFEEWYQQGLWGKKP
jgi:intracellular multiplication protein IcmV